MEKTYKLHKINLACGEDYREGYINIDNCSMGDFKVDVSADIFNFRTINDSIQEIYLSHFLMYARPDETKKLIKSFHDWLVKGGQLIIEQPDIRKICSIVSQETSQDKINEWGLVNIFGKYNQPPHRWGYSPQSLIDILHESGFITYEVAKGDKKPDRDFKITATK